MRAWQVHRHGEPADALRLVDVEPPVPGPGRCGFACARRRSACPTSSCADATVMGRDNTYPMPESMSDEAAAGFRIGFAAGRWPDVSVAHMVRRNYSVLGVYAGAYTRDENEHDHNRLMALVERGELKSCVTRSVAFDDRPSALEEVARGDAVGKLVVAAAS